MTNTKRLNGIGTLTISMNSINVEFTKEGAESWDFSLLNRAALSREIRDAGEGLVKSYGLKQARIQYNYKNNRGFHYDSVCL